MAITMTVPEWDLTDRLRKSLRESGVTIPEMAAALMVSTTTIGNYLGGRTTPKAAYLRVWSDRCGVPLDWLVGTSDLGKPQVRWTDPVAA